MHGQALKTHEIKLTYGNLKNHEPRNVKSEAESLIVAAQEQALHINYKKPNIVKTSEDPKSRTV